MPDIDGLEAVYTIRKYERDQELPPAYMISYTADATEIAARLLFGAGTNEIMLKPPPKEFIPNFVRRLRTDTDKQVAARFVAPGVK